LFKIQNVIGTQLGVLATGSSSGTYSEVETELCEECVYNESVVGGLDDYDESMLVYKERKKCWWTADRKKKQVVADDDDHDGRAAKVMGDVDLLLSHRHFDPKGLFCWSSDVEAAWAGLPNLSNWPTGEWDARERHTPESRTSVEVDWPDPIYPGGPKGKMTWRSEVK